VPKVIPYSGFLQIESEKTRRALCNNNITEIIFAITVFATKTSKQIEALLNEADGLINDYPVKADSVLVSHVP
jgi:hypothetical protein